MFSAEIIHAITTAAKEDELGIIVEFDTGSAFEGDVQPTPTADAFAAMQKIKRALHDKLFAWVANQPEIKATEIYGMTGATLYARSDVWKTVLKATNTPLHASDMILHLNKEVVLSLPPTN